MPTLSPVASSKATSDSEDSLSPSDAMAEAVANSKADSSEEWSEAKGRQMKAENLQSLFSAEIGRFDTLQVLLALTSMSGRRIESPTIVPDSVKLVN